MFFQKIGIIELLNTSSIEMLGNLFCIYRSSAQNSILNTIYSKNLDKIRI